MQKIIFIQPGYAHYRNQLFSILSKKHNILFIFERSTNVYPGEIKLDAFSYAFLDKGLPLGSFRLIRHLLIHRPSVVISSVSSSNRSFISFLYSILFRKRLILWILEWRKLSHSPHTLKRFLKGIKALIGTKLIQNAHSLVVGGSASKQYALSLGKDENDIFMAMQCSDDLRSQSDMKIEKIKQENSKYTFLYMSRIIPYKGLDILIKAFSLLRSKRDDVFLLIGGDGPFRKHCQQLAKSLEIFDISFLGPISPNSVVNLYAQADVFVLPSYYYKKIKHEAWGLVINEAMSMSLPIITTTAVGASFDLVVDGYNGFIVKDNDIVDLYKSMEKIINLDLVQMGKNSRFIFEEKNDFVKMANGFTSAIEHALSK